MRTDASNLQQIALVPLPTAEQRPESCHNNAESTSADLALELMGREVEVEACLWTRESTGDWAMKDPVAKTRRDLLENLGCRLATY